MTNNIVYQDNISDILLAKNCKRSSEEQMRALNIRFFVISDHIEKEDEKVAGE